MDSTKLVQNTISSDAFWLVNKCIAQMIGGKRGRDAALLLADLISKEKYFSNRGELNKDNYFFNSQENIERDTTLTPHEQRRIIKILIEKELIFTKIKKTTIGETIKHFKINHIGILKILSSRYEENELPDIKNFNSNKNKDNNNKNNKSLFHKDKKDVLVKTFNLIEFYNTLSNIQKHKNPDTQTYKISKKYLNQLKAGTFAQRNAIDPDFLKKHNISNTLLNKKWSDYEIKKVLVDIDRYHTVGYFPGLAPNGGNINRVSLQTILYNTQTHTSIFLWLAVEPPKLKISRQGDKHPQSTIKYLKVYLGCSERQKNDIIKNVDCIVTEHYKICEKLEEYYKHTSFGTHIGRAGKPEPFIKLHCEWLSQKNNPQINWMKANGTSWDYFLDHIKKGYDFNLDPTPKELVRIKKDSKQMEMIINSQKREAN